MLELFRGLADGPPPLVAPDFPLGASGIRADLAIVADEFIGVAIARPGSDPVALAGALPIYRRYFERVALVVTEGEPPAETCGAAVWRIDGEGRLTEERAGAANVVGISAWFDLMTLGERRALLGELLPDAHVHARGDPGVTLERVRSTCLARIAARLGPASEAFWTAIRGRVIAGADVSRLYPPVSVRIAA